MGDFPSGQRGQTVNLLSLTSVVRKDGLISLSDEGRQIAEKIYERHTIITKFFISLGVDEENASEDACKIEHDISDASFEAIKKYVEEK